MRLSTSCYITRPWDSTLRPKTVLTQGIWAVLLLERAKRYFVGFHSGLEFLLESKGKGWRRLRRVR